MCEQHFLWSSSVPRNVSDSLPNNCLGAAFYHSLCLSYASSCQGESLFFPLWNWKWSAYRWHHQHQRKAPGMPSSRTVSASKVLDAQAEPLCKASWHAKAITSRLTQSYIMALHHRVEPWFWSRLLRSQILMKFHFPSHVKIAGGLGLFSVFFSYTFNSGK